MAEEQYNSSSILSESEETHAGGHGKSFMSDIKGLKAGTLSCCSAIWGGLWQLGKLVGADLLIPQRATDLNTLAAVGRLCLYKQVLLE